MILVPVVVEKNIRNVTVRVTENANKIRNITRDKTGLLACQIL